jgi:hypothetical protein
MCSWRGAVSALNALQQTELRARARAVVEELLGTPATAATEPEAEIGGVVLTRGLLRELFVYSAQHGDTLTSQLLEGALAAGGCAPAVAQDLAKAAVRA